MDVFFLLPVGSALGDHLLELLLFLPVELFLALGYAVVGVFVTHHSKNN